MWPFVIGFSCVPSIEQFDSGINQKEEDIPQFSFETDVLPIFEQYECAQCHLQAIQTYETVMNSRAGVMNELFNACINMMWIEPFQPENSFLLHKIEGTHLDIGAQGGSTMPNEQGVDPQDATIIRQWILAGALP